MGTYLYFYGAWCRPHLDVRWTSIVSVELMKIKRVILEVGSQTLKMDKGNPKWSSQTIPKSIYVERMVESDPGMLQNSFPVESYRVHPDCSKVLSTILKTNSSRERVKSLFSRSFPWKSLFSIWIINCRDRRSRYALLDALQETSLQHLGFG